jgi:hypothetical protein
MCLQLLLNVVGGCLGAPQFFIPASSRVIRIVHDEKAVSTSSLRTGAAVAAPLLMFMQPIFHMVHAPAVLTMPGHFIAFAPPNSQKLVPSIHIEAPQLPEVPIIKKPELPQVPPTGKKLVFNVYGGPPVFQ